MPAPCRERKIAAGDANVHPDDRAMPSIKEFKFNCPSCGQRILAQTEWSGRRINCPSCETRIIIPPPAKAQQKKTQVLPSAAKTDSTSAAGATRVAIPSKPSPGPTAETPAPAAASKAAAGRPPAADPGLKTEAVTAPAQPERLRVAVLTPAIKLEMVRAVRRRIENETGWLPGRVKGANAYAAKVARGETVLVDAKSPEATRFSLIGAFLLEFHLRQVSRTAPGRPRLLDREIPDAIREVLLNELSDEEREQIGDPGANKDPMSVSHAQCLAALDVLEERYAQRMEQARAERAKRKLGNVRLPDLVKKLEKKSPVAPEEVATALYHELMDVRRRLDRLEDRAEPDQ